MEHGEEACPGEAEAEGEREREVARADQVLGPDWGWVVQVVEPLDRESGLEEVVSLAGDHLVHVSIPKSNMSRHLTILRPI